MAERQLQGTTTIEHDAVRRERERHWPGPGRGADRAALSPGPAQGPLPDATTVPDITLSTARGPAGRVALVAVLVAVVGAWGGLAAFAGPALGFSADGTRSWYWNTAHAVLWFAPGAAAVTLAALVLGFVPSTRRGRGRLVTASAGLAVMACGAWFVIGPAAWPALHPATAVFTPASPLRELAYQVVYSLGPGSLLLAFGGMVAGWGWRRRGVAPSSPRGRALLA